MTAKPKSDCSCKDYTVPFYIISALMTLSIATISFLAKATAEESEYRSKADNECIEKISQVQNKHDSDMLKIYREVSDKNEKILYELSDIKQRVSRING